MQCFYYSYIHYHFTLTPWSEQSGQEKISEQTGMWSRFAICVVFNKDSNKTTSFQKTVVSFPLSRIMANKMLYCFFIIHFEVKRKCQWRMRKEGRLKMFTKPCSSFFLETSASTLVSFSSWSGAWCLMAELRGSVSTDAERDWPMWSSTP